MFEANPGPFPTPPEAAREAGRTTPRAKRLLEEARAARGARGYRRFRSPAYFAKPTPTRGRQSERQARAGAGFRQRRARSSDGDHRNLRCRSPGVCAKEQLKTYVTEVLGKDVILGVEPARCPCRRDISDPRARPGCRTRLDARPDAAPHRSATCPRDHPATERQMRRCAANKRSGSHAPTPTAYRISLRPCSGP